MRITCHILFSLMLLIILVNEVIAADGWDITPRLTVGETFTDNVGLDPSGDEKGDAITQVNPGFSARRQSGRLDLFLDYNMQNLFFARDVEFETNHQLFGEATAELIKERFFLDADASIRQVVISAEERIPIDNLSQTGNRTDAFTYGLSPYWRNDFGGYVEALARYRFRGVNFGEGASDSLTHRVNVNLISGRRFTALTWGLNYLNEQLNRQDEEDSSRESADAHVNFRLSDEWTLLARGGYENNDLATFTDTKDGTFWSLGAGWRPSRFIGVTALYGPKDNEFSLSLNPTIRTSAVITRRERDVGIDPGVQWSASLNHRTRYSTWSASYIEEVTSVQELQFIQPFLMMVDDEGNQTFIDEQGRALTTRDVFTLRDAEFDRQYFQASVGYRGGHSRFDIRAFNEQRDFQTTDINDEEAYGVEASWNWRFAPKTRSTLSGEWDRIEFERGREDDLWIFRIGLARTFTSHMDGTVEYRYVRQDSTEPDQDYRENRISLFLTMVF